MRETGGRALLEQTEIHIHFPSACSNLTVLSKQRRSQDKVRTQEKQTLAGSRLSDLQNLRLGFFINKKK